MTSINGKVVGAPSPSRKKLDVNVLAAAIKAGNTADVQATLANANLAVEDDILFWDYSVDPEAGLCAATCLHYAAFHDCLPSVQWLLDVGANPAVRDALGRQPVHVCKDTAVKAELLRGETAYTAKQRMNKRESLAGSGGQAQPRAGTGDESSESLTATETKEDGMNSFELPEESSDVARKAAEILKEVERVKADRNSERLARAKAAEAQDALQKQFLPMIQALEVRRLRGL
jgi:Ankyrin repeats (many copies)